MRINTNIPALATVRRMTELERGLAQSLRRLSSGKRISEARDDAAGLAISERLGAQVRGLNRAAMNINQALGYLQTADGVLGSQMDLVQRMKELAVQASNGTMSFSDRQQLDRELQELVEEFNRVSEQAQLNGSFLLDGSFEELDLQVGTEKGDQISFEMQDSRGTAIFTNASTVGTGVFNFQQTLSLGDVSGITNSIDLRGDGSQDLIHVGASISIIANDGSGTFSVIQTLANTGQLEVGDLDGDGLDDLVVQDSAFEFTIYRQKPSGLFEETQSFNSNYALELPVFELKDFNGDGLLDILEREASVPSTTTANVYLNSGSSGFQMGTGGGLELSPVGALSDSNFVDLNGDNILDAYNVDNVNFRIGYRLGTASGTYGALQTISSSSNVWNSTAVDLNGDGYLDFYARSGATAVGIRYGSASGTFTAGATLTVAAGYDNTQAAQDVDGDGDHDLILSSTTLNSILVRYNLGNDTYSSDTIYTTGVTNPTNVVAQDLDGDGRIDLMAGTASLVGLLKGAGSGSFSGAVTSAVTITNFTSASLVDANADGLLDMVGNSSGVIFQNSSGGFGIAGTSVPPSGFAFGTYLDANSDGSLDLVQVNPTTETMRVLFQAVNLVEESANVRMTSQEDAQNLLAVFDRALQKMSERRAEIGAMQSRLESAINNTQIAIESLSAARSQLLDLDFASETAELTRLQILRQAQGAVLLQANASLKSVLRLLNP